MGKALYDDDGLRRDSQTVRRSERFIQHQPDVWYYEEKKGLYIVVHPDATYRNGSLAFVIPRNQILSYADRVVEEQSRG